MSTVTTSSSVSPMRPTFAAQLLGEPAREQPAQRLALLLAVDDRLVQHAQPLQRAAGRRSLAPSRQLEEELLDRVGDRGRRGAAATAAIALIGRPSATSWSSCLVGGGEPAVAGDRLHAAPRRSSGRAPIRRSRPRGPRGRAGCPRRRGPSAGTRSRPRRRRAARSRTRDRRTARGRPRRCRGGACAPPWPRRCPRCWKLGGMRMSVTSTWGAAASRARDQAVVVVGRPDDLEVGLQGEQRAHALAHDDVVVGEEHGDPAVRHTAH